MSEDKVYPYNPSIGEAVPQMAVLQEDTVHVDLNTVRLKPEVVQFVEKPPAGHTQTEEFKRELPSLIVQAALEAKLTRAYYLAYIAEGFTAEEAMRLCVH